MMRRKLTVRLQFLERLLDRPLFPWKSVLVGFSLGQFILEGFLSLRQYRVLSHTKPPKVLEGEVSQKVFDESQVSTAPLSGPCYRAIFSLRGLA
jgi:uncharacterized membrane protein